MKNEQTLIISSEKELSSNEISAIQNWIIADEDFVNKSVYLTAGSDIKKIAIQLIANGAKNNIVNNNDRQSLVIVDNEVKKSAEKEIKRKRGKKFERKNLGINEKLRLFLETEKKKKVKEVNFYELYAIVKAEFPNMTEKHLRIYLYNKKQLPGIQFDNEKKVIKFI